ncbi:gag-pol fusion protein-like protein, partial [Leptotrombidium deliense]
GSQFTSSIVKQLCDEFGVRQQFTSGYHPETHGQCERFNKTLKQMLRPYCESKPSKWDIYLPSVQLAYNTKVHDVTKYTPYFLMFGAEYKSPLVSDVIPKDSHWTTTLTANTNEKLCRALKDARTRIRRMQEKHAVRINDERQPVFFNIGEKVLHRDHISRLTAKLEWSMVSRRKMFLERLCCSMDWGTPT